MTYAIPKVTHFDKRTGKSYVAQASLGYEKEAIERVLARAEYDYQQTLPPEERARKQDTDFTCPHCKTKEPPTSRKEKVTTGFLFFVSTQIIDIFQCRQCQREFTANELYWEKEGVYRQNKAAILVEKVKDGEITREEMISALTPL